MSWSSAVSHKRRSLVLALGAAIALSLTAYLVASLIRYRAGFPLDDAWIHQTYARNLVMYGTWAFSPGISSAGSTAPLWTILLTPAHLLHLSPLVWVVVLAGGQLTLLAWLGIRWLRKRQIRASGFWVLFLLTEWHLLWAALSGMETLLFGIAALLMFVLLEEERLHPLWLGICVGVTVWIRPDAVTLFLPIGWSMLWSQQQTWKQKAVDILYIGVGFLALFLPYLAFNRSLSGEWWPSTFYAKQAEYAILRQQPLLRRLVDQFLLPLVGVGAVLLPGLLLTTVETIRRRHWRNLAGLLWVAAYLALYALRLPVLYQHGRYAMPVLPVFLLRGIEGMLTWIKPDDAQFWPRLLSRTWVVSAVAVQMVFLCIGAGAYSRDVAIIESEMVDTAVWIDSHLPDDALLAVHDIGAVGYYTEQPLLDLAGLVSPEVIPILRNEAALAAHLDEAGAAFLMTFPGWYPELVSRAEVIYTSEGNVSPQAGGENMSVYRWP